VPFGMLDALDVDIHVNSVAGCSTASTCRGRSEVELDRTWLPCLVRWEGVRACSEKATSNTGERGELAFGRLGTRVSGWVHSYKLSKSADHSLKESCTCARRASGDYSRKV
jgi:hypothetical protein